MSRSTRTHSRVRKDNAPENMAMLRHVALNLIKADQRVERGVQTRWKVAGWDEIFPAHLLGVHPAAERKEACRVQWVG